MNASQNYDMFIDIFERIENFFKRLESYTELPSSHAMTDGEDYGSLFSQSQQRRFNRDDAITAGTTLRCTEAVG